MDEPTSWARRCRRAARGSAIAALSVAALAVTACGVPPAPPTYRSDALSPGNRIHLDVGGPGSPDNLIVANPGGVSSWPADPVAAEDLRLDTLGLGDPTSDLRFAPLEGPSFHLGVVDGDGEVLLDLGPGVASLLFSADGSTFAVGAALAPTPAVIVYDTASLTVRRTIEWDTATFGLPSVVDLSRDGSTVLLSGAAGPVLPGGPAPATTIHVAPTAGDEPPTLVLAGTDEVRSDVRLTATGRIAYLAEVPGPTSTWQVRTLGADGGAPRTLVSFPAAGIAPNLAAELGSGRLVVEAPTAGSSTLSDLFTVEDSPSATRRTIASGVEISSTLGGLTRLVTPA